MITILDITILELKQTTLELMYKIFKLILSYELFSWYVVLH